MSFVSKLVQAGVKEVGEKTAKFLNQMPAADIAGAVQAVTKHPNEFADYLRHADNYANKGDQSGILPMIQMSNKWSNEVVDTATQVDTLKLGTTPVAKQNDLFTPQKKAQMSIQASGRGMDIPEIEGFKPANADSWQKYVTSEIEHHAEFGKGSGKYFTLEHLTDAKQNKRFRFDNKGLTEIDGQQVKKYSKKDLAKKKKDNQVTGSNYRAKKLESTISLDDYIAELGEDLGRKGYDLDQARFKRLYRWVGKNVHLDHINPIGREGFHHPSNLILLHAKDNLAKNAKVLPDSFFKEMGIPKTKAELIRSSIENTSMPPKVKRKKILEALGIID
tara:strand:+ start:555 stop:1553 length:999 start_codon:yes stop_codon:yes gene_type:complete